MKDLVSLTGLNICSLQIHVCSVKFLHDTVYKVPVYPLDTTSSMKVNWGTEQKSRLQGANSKIQISLNYCLVSSDRVPDKREYWR